MSAIIISPPPPKKPIKWDLWLSGGALLVAFGAATFAGLQYRATSFALVTEQRPWLNLENTVVNIADRSAKFYWKNRGKTPALNVESFEWDAIGTPTDKGFRTTFTSEKRHIRYNNIWVDGLLTTATLGPNALKSLPQMQSGSRLRLFGLVTYRDFLGTKTYHVYYCYEVWPNIALFPCSEPELNRID